MFEFELESTFRLLTAMLLGSIVGFERALRDKPAGFRTNILISVGACIFTQAGFALAGPHIDPTRIAAQVVSGVGFLGAGAIIRDSKGVVGLTTAATIWAVAAIGTACGLGEYTLAVTGTAVIVLVLIGLPFFGTVVEERRDSQEYRMLITKSEENLDMVERFFNLACLRITMRDYYERGDKMVFAVRAIGRRDAHRKLRRELALRDDVKLCEIH